MRTKTTLLTAALIAIGAISASAQSNVYSLNVVGYVNITVPASKFALISTPLGGAGGNFSVNTQLTNGVPDGSSLYFFNGSGFTAITFFPGFGWADAGGNLANNTMAPGTGAFFQNGGSTPCTLTITGEVLQGTNTTSVPVGFKIYSMAQPLATPLDGATAHFPAADGDSYFHYNIGTQTYDPTLTYFPGFGWADAGGNLQSPTPAVGEAVFIQHTGTATNWTYNFTVN